MKLSDFLILGGGIAGTTAAETLRELDPYASITILESEPYVLYSRVMIPAYLKHKVKRNALFLRNISDYVEKKIGLYLSTIAIDVNYQKREVYTNTGNIFPYRKLLIASGGVPRKWVLPGLASDVMTENIMRMHTLDDADLILSKIKKISTRETLVIGDSLIALEFIDLFIKNGLTPHILVTGNYFNEKKLGETGAKIVEDYFLRSEVVVHRHTDIGSVNGLELSLKNGEKISPSLIGVGIGIQRNLNAFAGLQKNVGILANDYLEASEENVYVAGDIAEFFDIHIKKHRTIGTWTNSFLQGRISALNMLASLSGSFDKKIQYRIIPEYNLTVLNFNLSYIGYLEDANGYWERSDRYNVARAFLKDGKMIGAVLVNCSILINKMVELIKINASADELEKAII